MERVFCPDKTVCLKSHYFVSCQKHLRQSPAQGLKYFVLFLLYSEFVVIFNFYIFREWQTIQRWQSFSLWRQLMVCSRHFKLCLGKKNLLHASWDVCNRDIVLFIFKKGRIKKFETLTSHFQSSKIFAESLNFSDLLKCFINRMKINCWNKFPWQTGHS